MCRIGGISMSGRKVTLLFGVSVVYNSSIDCVQGSVKLHLYELVDRCLAGWWQVGNIYRITLTYLAIINSLIPIYTA